MEKVVVGEISPGKDHRTTRFAQTTPMLRGPPGEQAASDAAAQRFQGCPGRSGRGQREQAEPVS